MSNLSRKMIAIATINKEEALEHKQRHHSDMLYYHLEKAVHHERELANEYSGISKEARIKHQHDLLNHTASADYHRKQREAMWNKQLGVKKRK